MQFQSKRSEDPRVDLTPLIDVVFLLLIFFMISTTFVSSPGIKVRLPKASSKEISKEKAEMKLTITAAGKVFLEDREQTDDALSRAFRAAYERDAETTVILRADRETEHGLVVQVMDLARRAKLRRLAIATEIQAESRP